MPNPAAPSGNPAADLKAQELKSLLKKLSTAPAGSPDIPADIAKLRTQIEDSNRVEILQATQTDLIALQAAIDISKDHPTIKGALTPAENAKLLEMNSAVTIEMNRVRTATNEILLTDIKEDVQQLGKDSISEDEGGGIAGTIQKMMLQFTKLKLAFDKLFAFSAEKKAEIATRENQLALDEFSLLGARGLREKFREKGAEYGISIRNGIRDKTAFKKLFEKFKKSPGDIDEFVDQELAIASSKISASTAAPKETTMYGILALKGQETKLTSVMGTEKILKYAPPGNEQYGVKFEDNILTVRDAAPGGATHTYGLTTGKELTKLATTAAKKAGAPGISPDVLGLLGASTGTKFTSAELEDQGIDNDDKVLGFAFQGSTGPMGLSKKRGSVSLDKAALKTILAELAAGNAIGLKNLVDKKIPAKGIFAKIKGSIEFKIEKIS